MLWLLAQLVTDNGPWNDDHWTQLWLWLDEAETQLKFTYC